MLPTKFQVNWPFGSGEEEKIDFQDGAYQVLSQLAQGCRRNRLLKETVDATQWTTQTLTHHNSSS